MRVLVACEFSGRVREAFREAGHDAYSCDLLETEIPGNHFQCDVIEVLDRKWDLLIAHPPCTYLCNSGVRWLYTGEKHWNTHKVKDTSRWTHMLKAAGFFRMLLNCKVPHICVENPIPHQHAMKIIGESYSQIIQPWQFGHPETKATCLWLKGLPLLRPTQIVGGRENRIHKAPDSKDRWKRRSRTYLGIAKALAEQYGNI